MEDDSQTWFWNKSVNETDLDSEEEDNDEDNNKNLEREYPKIESKASFEVLKQKLKQNKKGKRSFCRGYRIRSRSSKKE